MLKRLISIGTLIGAFIIVGILSAILPGILNGGGSAAGGGGGIVSQLDPGFGLPDFDTSVGTIEIPPIAAIGFEGRQISELAAFGILTGLVIALTIGAGLPLAIIYKMLDGTATTLRDDDEYKGAVSQLQTRAKEERKQWLQESPPNPVPDRNYDSIAFWATAGLFAMILAVVGAAFSDNFVGGANQFWYSAIFGLIGFVATVFLLNRDSPQADGENVAAKVDGGVIWVIVTGLVVVGLGLGMMMWVRLQGAI